MAKINYGWLKDFSGAYFFPKVLAQFIFNDDGTRYIDTTKESLNNRTQVRICLWESGDTGDTSTGEDILAQ